MLNGTSPLYTFTLTPAHTPPRIDHLDAHNQKETLAGPTKVIKPHPNMNYDEKYFWQGIRVSFTDSCRYFITSIALEMLEEATQVGKLTFASRTFISVGNLGTDVVVELTVL